MTPGSGKRGAMQLGELAQDAREAVLPSSPRSCELLPLKFSAKAANLGAREEKQDH